MTPRERFAAVHAQVKALLATVPDPPQRADRPVAEYFRAREAQLPTLREAERLLTDALDEFPLHPYLLDWRADVRSRMLTADGASGAAAAVPDLELAIEVAPDYMVPRLRHADVIYWKLHDPDRAAPLFAQTLAKIEQQLCDCVAGMAEALSDVDKAAAARALLARWLVMFPDNPRLARAAEWIKDGKPS